MIREAEVRAKLIDVLQGDESFEEFAEWLSLARVNAHLDSSQEAQELAAAVAVPLYEYFEGHMPEPRLWIELAKIVRNVRVSLGTPSVSSESMASTREVTFEPVPV
jgi:hypothetical protein